MLVRFVAVAIIGLSLLTEGMYLAETLVGHRVVDKLHCALLAIPVLIGVVILARSRAVAEWLSEMLE